MEEERGKLLKRMSMDTFIGDGTKGGENPDRCMETADIPKPRAEGGMKLTG